MSTTPEFKMKSDHLKRRHPVFVLVTEWCARNQLTSFDELFKVLGRSTVQGMSPHRMRLLGGLTETTADNLLKRLAPFASNPESRTELRSLVLQWTNREVNLSGLTDMQEREVRNLVASMRSKNISDFNKDHE